MRFLSLPVDLAEGTSPSWQTITRVGTFTDPRYGTFDITPKMLAQMVSNFDAGVLGQDVFIDVAHKFNDGAAARVVKLAVENGRLRALLEFTEFGEEAVQKRGFRYLSADFDEQWHDNEAGKNHGCVLLGAGLTTRPVIKHLDRVQLGTPDPDDADGALRLAVHPNLRKLLEHHDMNKHLQALRARLLAMAGLTAMHVDPIVASAQKQLEPAAADEAKCLAVVETFAAAGEALSTHVKALGGAAAGPVTLSIAAPDAAAVSSAVDAAVARTLAARDDATKAAATALAGKVKLLSDAVGESKTLSDEQKAAIVAEMTPHVTASTPDDQVKNLAQTALGWAARASAATQLATLGYRPPSGSVHIVVEGDGQISALQAQVDKRLGLDDSNPEQRYERTGGRLLNKNKAFAEKCLAQYDAAHGERLVAERKLLAAGTGVTSDVAVPAIFERTVLREALYNLVGLAFVDVGTYPFNAVAQIPYSYRDTTAAGVSQARTYEGQPIPRAGVVQTFEEARPIPQKLSFRISNEMKYLVAAAPIDFDAVAENTRNVIRIVGEDTDRLIQNAIIRSADRAPGYTAAGNDTLTAQVNGTNKIFVLSQWPVCYPRKVYDLKGNQVGATEFPITVTLNGVARNEYLAGVALAAGLYWVLDYNLGEIRFVNESGVLQTPTSGWVLSVQYTYTLNVAKANLDLQAGDKLGDVYDRVLTLIGGRKVAIENDRFYTANMLLLSGAIDNALGQANTFMANSARAGTGLDADGSIGMVKGVKAWNTRAPGLDTGDVRIVVGERGNTRFRMMKPWSMTELSEARDANGNFIGMQEAYGEQYIVSHTPTQRRNATTSVVLYSATGRVARAA